MSDGAAVGGGARTRPPASPVSLGAVLWSDGGGGGGGAEGTRRLTAPAGRAAGRVVRDIRRRGRTPSTRHVQGAIDRQQAVN